ncbi:MAG: hypothetical protein EPO28_09555 [Saprospiraceae bacterium]|nr:MAG: hypothetical protein EPO28_09555 [Saprospiraceae bacterium]
MESLFNRERHNLEALVKVGRLNVGQFDGFSYFIKGDISGIQDFIFTVKSEKAAKTLKARSYFIQALSEISVRLIEDKMGEGNIALLYNGGGNFYLFAKETIIQELPNIREAVNEACKEEEYYVTLSVVKTGNLFDFGETWKSIQQKSTKDKLEKFEGFSVVYDAFTTPPAEEWKTFTPNFTKAEGFDLRTTANPSPKVSWSGIKSVGYKLELCHPDQSGCNGNQFEKSMVNKVPRWDGDLLNKYEEEIKALRQQKKEDDDDKSSIPKEGGVIEFQWLTRFAKDRTGTDKLAVLTMDVDNLGKLFDHFDEITDLKASSDALKWFFDHFMLTLWNEKFTWHEKLENDKVEERQEEFKNNIYVVFSGGDDCFLLGAWDAVFEFALRLQQEFDSFADWLKDNVKTIKDKPTLSAGLIVVDPNYPVVRFADLAKEALKTAKNFKDKNGGQPKNHISVFGQVLTWKEFEEAKNLSGKLRILIQEKGESRAVIERIKHSADGYENLQNAALRGDVPAPKVHRLFYYLRNVKKKDNLKEMNEIIQDYANALIAAFEQKTPVNPMKFPVAARWAEFLTR